MQFFTLATTALLASTGLAASSERTVVTSRGYPSVIVQFVGAADALQNQWVPVDGSTQPVAATFGPSHVRISSGPSNVYCVAKGKDGSVTYFSGAETVDIGPPQVQISVSCSFGPK